MSAISASAHELVALRLRDPDAYAHRIRDALRSAGSIPQAARLLGISVRALHRWIEVEPELVVGMELRGPGNPLFGPGYGNGRSKKALKVPT